MLESLGYEEAASRDDADLILFNTCSIRESADNRFIAHLGEAKRLKSEDPERVVGVGGCWAQSVKDEVFQRFPFVDVAFGPGQIHKLAEFLNSDSLSAQGYFEFEDFSGHLPTRRVREFQGWLQVSQGCNCKCAYCIVPSTRGREVSRDPGRAGRRGRGARRRRRPRGDPARPERQQLRPRPAGGVADRLRRAAGPGRRDRRDRAHPLHQPAPEGHEGGRDPRPRRAALGLRAHPPAAAVGLQRRCSSGCAAPTTAQRYMDRVSLIREHVPDCAITTDIIVGFPGRDRGRLRADPGSGRRGRLRQRLHLRLLAAARNRGGRVRRADSAPGQGRADGAAGRAGAAAGRRNGHSGSSGARSRSWSKGPAGPTRRGCGGASRHNKAVNFDGTAQPGEFVMVEIDVGHLADA